MQRRHLQMFDNLALGKEKSMASDRHLRKPKVGHNVIVVSGFMYHTENRARICPGCKAEWYAEEDKTNDTVWVHKRIAGQTKFNRMDNDRLDVSGNNVAVQCCTVEITESDRLLTKLESVVNNTTIK